MQKSILTLGLVGIMAFFTACSDSSSTNSHSDSAVNEKCKKECEVKCKEEAKEECKKECETKCPSYGHAASIKDLDEDGKISKEEYLSTREEMFQKLDTDGDGFISEEETTAHKKAVCAEKCDSTLSKEECKEMSKKDCEILCKEKCKEEK